MNALDRLGWPLGFALVGLLAACGSDGEGDAQDDASAPTDAGRDAASATSDAGIDSGSTDAGQLDAGELDAGDGGPRDAGLRNIQLMVNLTTGSEVPPCMLAGPSASGTASIVLWPEDPPLTTISVGLGWQNLSSAVTSAHIHYGDAGVSGPVVLPFTMLTLGSSFTAMDYQAAPGAPVSFDAFMQEFLAGRAYINVHTTSCPNGEIRGQIVPPSTTP